MALALILNRHLREHFTLNLERDGLIDDREAALNDARRLAKSKSDIVATLSHEIRNGLSGVAHVLGGAPGAVSRGPPARVQLKPPLHDHFPFDFVAQVLYPGRIVDAYEWTFDLEPKQYPTREELIDRSRALQNQLE